MHNNTNDKIIININATNVHDLCISDGRGREAQLILQGKINQHNTMGCECYNKTSNEPCSAFLWITGKIPSKNIVEDYYLELRRKKNNR